MRIYLLLLVLSLFMSRTASAGYGGIPPYLSDPAAGYDYRTGKIRIRNTEGSPLANVSLLSIGGNLTTPSAMLSIPGTTKDDSEFPYALTYLNFPVGTHDVGFVVKVKPGANFHSDLRFEYRLNSLLEPVSLGVIWRIPEPSALALATCGLSLLTCQRGRLKRV